jgi:murein DD-endopeptidase MepM/ murein hydrolase activator NlpD
MKRRNRKQFFSIIFVPDQELDPKSVSMSYTMGRLLLAIMTVLVIHFILGGIAYYRVMRLEKTAGTLVDENQELKARNRKIEQLWKEFNQIRAFDEKIRKAFGQTLGLAQSDEQALQSPRMPVQQRRHDSEEIPAEASSQMTNLEQLQNSRYFLTEKRGDYFDPDFLPTGLPVEGFLTTHFQRGGWFEGRSHNGIDIAAKKGTVIRAAGAGIVILADWTPDYGNVMVISHGNGFVTYYAHALRLLAAQGHRVRKGQPIALLGSSGSSSAPHLHFEIWKDGVPIDPEKFIFAMRRSEAETGP